MHIYHSKTVNLYFVIHTEICILFQIQLTPQQLQMIRMQVQGGSNQPIIIQTAPIQAQPQLIQVAQGAQAPVFLQTSGTDNE